MSLLTPGYIFHRSRVSVPREKFWDIQVAKIDSPTRQALCPDRPASVLLRHTLVTSALATQHSLKWLDAIVRMPTLFFLWCFARWINRAASSFSGTNRLRFALLGGQRKHKSFYDNSAQRSEDANLVCYQCLPADRYCQERAGYPEAVSLHAFLHNLEVNLFE